MSKPQPEGFFDPRTLFWSHERLHRQVIQNYPERLAVYRDERDGLETEFLQGALQLRDAPPEERQAFSEDCFHKAAAKGESWLDQVKRIPPKPAIIHQAAWRSFNRDVGLKI
jgi:hypothetical protein